MAKECFVCHIGPNFQISLIYVIIGCPQSVIYRPEMLKFYPYSILTRDTRVEFVIYGVFSRNLVSQHLFFSKNVYNFVNFGNVSDSGFYLFTLKSLKTSTRLRLKTLHSLPTCLLGTSDRVYTENTVRKSAKFDQIEHLNYIF